jgi:arsenate reductase
MGDKVLISRQRSKSVDEFRDTEFDFVITVCYHAAGNCPLWLGPGQVQHIKFPDPALAEMGGIAAKGGFYATPRNL